HSAIMTAVQYLAFTVKIHTITTVPWKYVGDLVRFIRLAPLDIFNFYNGLRDSTGNLP
ncbi:Hypothetical protein FKW44_008115, partial [Caligus rogercresseyi]